MNSTRTGPILKSKLGLDNFKYVVVVRVLSTPYKTYMIFFNSRWPNVPMTGTRIYKHPMPSMLYTYPFNKRPNMGPPVDINDFNGMIENGLYFVVDLAGELADSSKRTRVIESSNKSYNEFVLFGKNLQSLLEGLTIPDIKKNAISSRNKEWLDKRRKEGFTGSFLEAVNWIEDSNEIVLEFAVKPTYDIPALNFTPEGKEYEDTKYTVEIVFENVSKFLGSKDTFKSFSNKEQGDLVLDMIDKAEVRIWSSDPSWIFQGSFEAFDDLDASPYPLWAPHGRGVWNSRHGIEPHVTKHLAEIFEILKPLYQDIAIELRK